jgi:hypothetical protein
LGPRPRGPQISCDPKAEFLTKLADSIGGGWLERRRFVREIEHHLDDSVAELTRDGLPEDEAVSDALARLGDVDAITGAFRVSRATRRRSWPRAVRVPVAWLAVGAMSIVTLAAAELPQASGAKVPEFRVTPVPHVRVWQAGRQPPPSSGTRQHAKARTHPPRTCRCSRDLARGRWRN